MDAAVSFLLISAHVVACLNLMLIALLALRR